MDRERDVTPPPNAKFMKVMRFVLGGLLIFIVLIFILAALGERTLKEEAEVAAAAAAEPAGPPTVATADPAIRSVAVDGADLRVNVLIPGAWSSGDYPPQTGSVVEAIGKALQAGAGDAGSAQRLVLTVDAPGTDRLGNDMEVRLYTVFFDISDLRAARFDNLSYGRVLDLATGMSLATAGRRTMIEYCASERGRSQSAGFCALPL